MQIGGLEEHAAAKPLVPGDGLHNTLGCLQRTVHDVRVCRRAERRSVGGKPADRLDVVLREGAYGERCSFRKLAEASAQDPTSFGEQAYGNAGSRGIVVAFDDAIVVGAEAELEIDALRKMPPVLCESRELRAADFW